MRRRFLATIAIVFGVLTIPQSASADKRSSRCPPGFDLGALTLEQGLQLPNILAGLAAGVYDVEGVAAIFEFVDANDDGLICFQSFPSDASDSSLLQYNYNVVDNNASVPSG